MAVELQQNSGPKRFISGGCVAEVCLHRLLRLCFAIWQQGCEVCVQMLFDVVNRSPPTVAVEHTVKATPRSATEAVLSSRLPVLACQHVVPHWSAAHCSLALGLAC